MPVYKLPPQLERKEAAIQEALEKYLRERGWFVLRTHGNMFQSGFPDNYAVHPKYGARWIEVKLPDATQSKFTPAQLDTFPQLIRHGAGVWVLTGASKEEYEKLFRPGNAWSYMMEKL